MNKVEYHKLGSSGLSISPIIIGCMTFGNFHNWGITEEDSVMKILKKCYDNGLERLIRSMYTLMDYREIDYVNSQGLSRKHIFNAVEHSVKNLGTYIDVLQIHRMDRNIPKDEIMKALHDVVQGGDVRYLGASSMKAFEFAQLQFIAVKNGWTKFISMQNYYNLVYREEEREMIPFCNENEFGKVGVIPYSPIASGLLARPLASKGTKRSKNGPIYSKKGLDNPTDADKKIVNRVQEIAEKYNVSMATVATRWIISKGTSPIVGVNSIERVDDFIKALSFELNESEIASLEEPYVAKAEYKT